MKGDLGVAVWLLDVLVHQVACIGGMLSVTCQGKEGRMFFIACCGTVGCVHRRLFTAYTRMHTYPANAHTVLVDQ